MKQLLIATIFILNVSSTYSQSKTPQLEIEPFLRWDTYPKFTNAINSIATYQISIKGLSWGLNIAYKVPLEKSIFLRTGIGYYRYSFNHIESAHRTFGKGNRRIIEYPTQLDMILATDKYWYHTICFNIGIEKQYNLSNDLQFNMGISAKNYLTFSQLYHMPYDNSYVPQPELKIINNYKTNSSRYFGFGTELNLALLKKMGKVNIGPSLIIPVFDLWKQDRIFPTEANSGERNKWFGGLGAGIRINYPLL